MGTKTQIATHEQLERVREQRAGTLLAEGHDLRTLAQHIAVLESERYEMATRIEDAETDRDNANNAVADVSTWAVPVDVLYPLVGEVTAGWYRSRAVSVERLDPITTRIVLDVDASAGEAMHFYAGDEFVLSTATAEDFQALEQLI